MNLVTRVIFYLVRFGWWNPNPLSGRDPDSMTIHLHDSFAREHVEKLLRVMVEVANLRCARRHALLNHA